MADVEPPEAADEAQPASKRAAREPELPVSVQEVDQAFQGLIDDADTGRVEGLTGLEAVRRARVEALTREAKLLEALDDPLADAVIVSLDTNVAAAQQFGAAARRAAVPPPSPGEDTWTVHGHVLDEQLEPVSGASVQLVDRKGARLKDATTTTDDEGYFELEVAPPAARAAKQAPQVFLKVTAGRSRVLHEGKEPLTPAAGAVEYAEIHVKDGNR
jgi:Carboxypeptidase regulatory-like domain